MNEIEIKAHIYQKENLIKTLNSFAKFDGAITRADTYYKKGSSPSLRIRKETKNGLTKNFITYKKKEKREDSSGVIIEVNEENETTIEDLSVLEKFLLDSGYEIYLKKHKDVMDWKFRYKNYEVTFELCAVPPLGDFLEIEILSEQNDEKSISTLKEILLELLDKCGVPRENIEERYYSEMIKNLGEADV